MASICGGLSSPVFDPRDEAARFGIRIEVIDLGNWGAATLVSEYDPAGPAIRINERAIERYRRRRGSLSSCDIRAFIDFAIAHELYHHLEASGQIARRGTELEREKAADAYARANVRIDVYLDAFITLS